MKPDSNFPKFIKKYTAHCLITAVLCIPPGYYLFTEFKEIKKNELELKEKELEFEKYRSEKIEELKDREAELIKREGALKEKNMASINDGTIKTKETAERINKKEQDLKAKEQTLKSREKEINKLKNKYSDAAIKVNAEQKVIALMDKFSALGVDLNHEDWCDKEYTKRYYEGDAILKQISSIAQSHRLNTNYIIFVRKSKPSFATDYPGKGECIKNDNGVASKQSP